MSPVIWMSAFVGVVIFLMQSETASGEMCYAPCRNGREYLVRNLPDKNQAAQLLDETHQQLIKACLVLQKNHPDDPRVSRLVSRFANTTICESLANNGNTSYSINKGEKIYLCLRAKDGSNSFVDPNLLLFVALHEISHIMTTSVGHTPEFWENFKFVLENCQAANIYQCIDFSKDPRAYCGMTVTNSPASCPAPQK